MPMYEYKCEECGKRYEQLRKMSEADSNLVCPNCGSNQVKREISTCAIGGGATPGAFNGGVGGGGGGCGHRFR